MIAAGKYRLQNCTNSQSSYLTLKTSRFGSMATRVLAWYRTQKKIRRGANCEKIYSLLCTIQTLLLSNIKFSFKNVLNDVYLPKQILDIWLTFLRNKSPPEL